MSYFNYELHDHEIAMRCILTWENVAHQLCYNLGGMQLDRQALSSCCQ